MSACVLFGHKWTLMRGAGQFKDAEFLVCEACGKTIPITEANKEIEDMVRPPRGVSVTWASPDE